MFMRWVEVGVGRLIQPRPMEESPADSMSQHEPVDALLERALDMLWARRVVRLLTPIKGLSWTVRATLCTALLFAVFLGGALATGEPRTLLGLHAWAATLLGASLLLYDWLAGRVLSAFRDSVLPSLPSDTVHRARALLLESPVLRWQGALSVGVGVLTALLLMPVLYAATGRVVPFAAGIVAVGSSLTTSLVYVPAMATVMAFLARDADDLPPLAPQHARLVRTVQRTGHWIVLVTAGVATVGVLAPLVLPGLGLVGPVLAVLVLLGAVSSTGMQFGLQQVVLAALVNARRDRTLDELQARVARLYGRLDELTTDERDELLALVNLHDRVAQVPDLLVSLRSLLEFARPLVVPLASAVLVHLVRAPHSSGLDALLRLLGP